MKKIIGIIAMTIWLSSCDVLFGWYPDFPELPAGVNNLESAYIWVSTNIEYVSDAEAYGVESWHGPNDILASGKGDCEEFAVLLACFSWRLGLDSRFCMGNGHAVAKIEGKIYDCTPVLNSNGIGHHPGKFEIDNSIYDFTVDEGINDTLTYIHNKYDSE